MNGLKSLNNDSKVLQSSSRSNLVSSHNKFNLPESETELSQTTISFSSLSELAAHHLKNSGSLTSPFKKGGLNIRNFPLVTKKKEEPSKTLFNLKNNFSECVVNTIAKDISTLQLDQNVDEIDKNSSIEIDDEWEIDLSSALKTVDLTKFKCPRAENSKSAITSTVRSNLNKPNFSAMCNFNLINLRTKKLKYSVKKASPLGTVLCRKWKTKMPHMNRKAWYFQASPNIVRFDFSEPSPDNKILKHLKKRLSTPI